MSRRRGTGGGRRRRPITPPPLAILLLGAVIVLLVVGAGVLQHRLSVRADQVAEGLAPAQEVGLPGKDRHYGAPRVGDEDPLAEERLAGPWPDVAEEGAGSQDDAGEGADVAPLRDTTFEGAITPQPPRSRPTSPPATSPSSSSSNPTSPGPASPPPPPPPVPPPAPEVDIFEPSTRQADEDAPPSIPAAEASETCGTSARCGAPPVQAADGQAVEVAGPAGSGTMTLTRVQPPCTGRQLSWTLDVTATEPLQVNPDHLAVTLDGQRLNPAPFDLVDLAAGESAQRTVIVDLPADVTTCDAAAQVGYDAGSDQVHVVWSR